MADQFTSDGLAALARTIRARRLATAETSYTRKLLDAGPAKCAKKFGEEAVEFALAVAGENDESVIGEAADVLYHLLVALESRDVPLEHVYARLEARTARSGLEEKKSRKDDAGGGA